MPDDMWPVCLLMCASAVYTYTQYTFQQNLTVDLSIISSFCASSLLHSKFLAVDLAIQQSAHAYMCRPDKREVLANQVGILMPSRVLCLQPLSTPFDPHYRLATRQDVKRNMQSLCEVMPAWEVAHLSDGWVEGIAYGSKIG